MAGAGGEILVERFARACKTLEGKLIFAVRAQDVRRYHIDSIIALAAVGSVVVKVAGETKGAACTALLCIEHIDPNDELLLSACAAGRGRPRRKQGECGNAAEAFHSFLPFDF